MGLVGFGKIPKEIARKVAALGMVVLTYDIYIAEEHIRSADVVSVYVPLNVEIKHMFTLYLFREIKPEGYFINVGRCQLVNESELVEAIEKKIIASATSDVTESELVQKNNPLLGLYNVIITPYQAWYSDETEIRLQLGAAGDVARVLSGYCPKNLVTPRVRNIVKLKELEKIYYDIFQYKHIK